MIGRGKDRIRLIDGLRALADFYERHPDAYYDGASVSLSMYIGGEKARSVLASMVRIFVEYEELYDSKYATVARHFGKKVKLELFAPRSRVCRGTVIGTRTEPALVLPATKEVYIPERVVEIVEWRCSALLNGEDA